MNDCCDDNQKCRYGVGSNMPGYMPDSDVAHFSNWKDARDCWIADCERALEEEEHPERYSVERRTIERARKCRKVTELQTKIGQYVYWLARI